MLLETITVVVAVMAVVWVGSALFLSTPDTSAFDTPQHELHRDRSGISAQNSEVLRLVAEMQDELRSVSRRKRIYRLRRILDEGFTGSPPIAEKLGVQIRATEANGVDAEWVLAPGANHDRRLLYIHGGSFIAGSPVSHRMITAALSRASGVAVLAIDYRLMPEHLRKAASADCRAAYRYLLGHGPSGPGDADRIYVAGDSAGGSLTLLLSAWARDQDVRPMDGVIAFSPSTDWSLASPSLRRNIETDPMLGPGLGPLARLPATLRALTALIAGQSSPRSPLVSPLFGDLGDLPPTLVQVSDCEMLFDDAQRYVNKARAQGSPVTLQVWPGMVHVWQMFQHVLPEARQSIDDVAAFMAADSSTDFRASLRSADGIP